MSDVVEFLTDIAVSAYDAVYDAVAFVWDEVTTPMLEEVFSWFGIVDENVLIVQKVSILLHGDNTEDVIAAAKTKAVLAMSLEGGSFFPWYIKHTRQTAAQIKGFYSYAEQERYIYGLPEMAVKASDIDYTALQTALDTDLGFAATILSSSSQIPRDYLYFQDVLQASPTLYLPYANTLTYTDIYGVSWSDWLFDSVTYNSGPDTWDLNIYRVAAQALFWIEGPVHRVEGDSITYTIKCNRTVPAGESVDISLAYSGTAPGTDYTPVSSVTMLAGTSEITAVVATAENAAVDGSRTVIVTIDGVTNTSAAFEHVGIYTVDSVTTTITDDEGIILTMPSVLVNESAGSATVPVKLESATTGGAFTVDYAFTDGTALGSGVDYTSTGGTLNFAGTAAEVQNITIPITTDAADDNEYFTVYLTNCSDATVDITHTCTVTITDDSDLTPVAANANLYDVITKPGYVPENSMVVQYHADVDPSTEWFYWIYKYSDGTYPDVDQSMSVLTQLSMLPIGILRSDKVNINVDKTSDEYRSTKRLLGYLLMDIEEVITNIDANPDIDSINDVFINFALCPNSDVEIVSKVLYLMYYNIVVTHVVTSNSNMYTASFEEQGIQNAVVWTDHTYTAGVAGTLSSGQEYEHEIIQIPEITEYNIDTGQFEVIQEEGSELYIRNQVSTGLYDELVIYDLNGMAAIEYAGFHEMALSTLGDDIFTIPLSYFILDKLDPLEKMVLYQHMLRLDIYCATIVELAWYQQDSFQQLFQFVMIVITVYTLGATSWWQLMYQLALNYLIFELVIFLAELTGNAEFAAIVGLVAVISLGGAGAGSFDMTSAEGLVNMSTKFSHNLTAGYDVLTTGLKEDLDDLNQKAEERLDSMKDEAPQESAITADFLVALKSVDTTVFPAIKAQYDFDLIYNYDRIIADYHQIHLQTGVL